MNWVSSKCNQMAENYFKKYCVTEAPFFTLIYGPEGMGKSLLLQSSFRRLNQEQEGTLFLDASSFVQQYTFAAQEGKLSAFRRKLRSPSLLILDHLEHLEGKVHSIEEFYHTYEALWEKNGRMICGFSGKLTDLDFLGEKLASRLRGGMAIPIREPSQEELWNFLDLIGRSRYLVLEEKILDLMAQQVNNFRDGKKLLEDFLHYVQEREDIPDMGTFEQFVTEQAKARHHRAEPENIVEQVAKIYHLDPQDLYGTSRRLQVRQGRQLAIYLIRELCGFSYPVIGRIMNKSHSHILNTCEKFKEEVKNNLELKKQYEELLRFFEVQERGKSTDE